MALQGNPINGPDLIFGDNLDNYINALDGDDTVFGNGGNDFIEDSSGPNSGNDVFFGDRGNDTLYGWAGNDDLHGGGGNDYLDGYSGNAFSKEYDVLTGSSLNIFGDGQDTFGLGFSGYPMYYQKAVFAMITDFNGADRFSSSGDRILLGGSASQYKFTYEDRSSLGTMSGSNNPLIKDTIIRSASNPSDIIGIVEDINIVGADVFTYV
ncbi:calcium-binding protein [Gloeocapsopsis dulcis]|uniref:Calcium-binding protein n=1 Tax=Gloeocapsopsis dulcis AAB1 = 1H9 TaxID=1433147 RepID=A0A6N8FWJ1_9CHRO|nr:hypothetical protein [Gloeocapsopsis dulcis]MUL36316.1 hypothetical protein [Gloeocapsopsis dulcis AAB1 = 1H9]WNN89573.1 hypothetical protein P0S91_00270 [Gloeocapsopsis dulcis]